MVKVFPKAIRHPCQYHPFIQSHKNNKPKHGLSKKKHTENPFLKPIRRETFSFSLVLPCLSLAQPHGGSMGRMKSSRALSQKRTEPSKNILYFWHLISNAIPHNCHVKFARWTLWNSRSTNEKIRTNELNICHMFSILLPTTMSSTASFWWAISASPVPRTASPPPAVHGRAKPPLRSNLRADSQVFSKSPDLLRILKS